MTAGQGPQGQRGQQEHRQLSRERLHLRLSWRLLAPGLCKNKLAGRSSALHACHLGSSGQLFLDVGSKCAWLCSIITLGFCSSPVLVGGGWGLKGKRV